MFIGNIQNHAHASFSAGVALVLLLTSCAAPQPGQIRTLSTYRNERYGFEFAYPSHWLQAAPPTNFDGRTFRNPQNLEVEVRGWARHLLPLNGKQKRLHPTPLEVLEPLELNFTTQQGLKGELKTEIGVETSTITLTLHQRGILYVWQGRSPNEDFAEYYRLFYHLARRYRIVDPRDSANAPI